MSKLKYFRSNDMSSSFTVRVNTPAGLMSVVFVLLNIIMLVVNIILAPYNADAPGMNMVFYAFELFIMLLSLYCLARYLVILRKRNLRQDKDALQALEEKDKLARELSEKNEQLEQTYWEMVNTLIGVIEARDNFTGGHSVKVCEYSVKLAKKVGLSDDDTLKVMKASILHDIGKMGIPDNILLKSGALSSDEYGTIMNHPEIGCKILSKVKGLEDILPLILYHHERVDGTGYPFGLAGEKIPLGARIIAIADAYDAMTSNRPYRNGMVKKEARKRLAEGSETQFDAELVKCFMEILDSDNVENLDDYRRNDLEKIKRYAGIV